MAAIIQAQLASSSYAEIMGLNTMKISTQKFNLSKKIITLSVLAAMGSAHADEEVIKELTKNESSVSAGLGVASGDSLSRSLFGQYNGLRNNEANLLLDFNLIQLDDKTGTWTKFEGHNLGLDNAELSATQNKQGDWKYSLEYNEITHHEIRTINTGVQGAGSTSPVVSSLLTPGTGAGLNLKLERQAVTLGAEKWLSPNLMFEASFKNEDKSGARLSGAGITCSTFPAVSRYSCGTTGANSGALLLLPEPVNTQTKQFEAKLNYTGDKFLVSGGYYGSYFTNSNGSMNPTLSGNLSNPNGTVLNPVASGLSGYLASPLALQPDNQAQQVYVSGNYALTASTHSTFKLAHTHATQNDSFSSMGLAGAPAGVGNLGGVIDTDLVQFGLTSHPISKLSLLANVRYEDKNDKTPLAQYNATAAGVPYANNYSNSAKKLNGKLEASYQFSNTYRGTLGVDYASIDRATPAATTDTSASDLALSVGGLREKTHEVSYRAEVRRSMSETVNAAVSYVQSQRSGDNWTMYNPNGTLPMSMLDRKRDKVRLSSDWTPINKLSIQFNLEEGRDSYTSPTSPIEAGIRDGQMGLIGIDANWALSEKWKLTGYLNQANQTLHVNHTSAYLADLETVNTSIGFGVINKPSSILDLGGNLSYMNDSNRYNQNSGALPDVTYRITSLKLYGKYAMEKSTDIRVDLVHQNATLDEWTWGSNGTQFAYSDNSTVSMQPNQSVTFLGVRYVYKYR